MKKNFVEPEMEVVRFNAQDILTGRSGCPSDNTMPIGPGLGCSNPPGDAMIIG